MHISGFENTQELFVDMTSDQMATTNAYRLFINRSCPLKTQCSLFNKLIEQQVDIR